MDAAIGAIVWIAAIYGTVVSCCEWVFSLWRVTVGAVHSALPIVIVFLATPLVVRAVASFRRNWVKAGRRLAS